MWRCSPDAHPRLRLDQSQTPNPSRVFDAARRVQRLLSLDSASPGENFNHVENVPATLRLIIHLACLTSRTLSATCSLTLIGEKEKFSMFLSAACPLSRSFPKHDVSLTASTSCVLIGRAQKAQTRAESRSSGSRLTGFRSDGSLMIRKRGERTFK